MAENIKETSESREILRIDEDVKKIKNSSSSWYYASLILLNVISLLISFLYLDYCGYDIQKFSTIFAEFDYKCIWLLLVCFLIILFLQTLPIFLRLYGKTKNKNFAIVFGGVINFEYFSRVTLGGSGGLPLAVNVISKNKIKEDAAIDGVYGHKCFDRISFLMYSIVLIALGLIFWSDNVNVILIIVALVIIVVNLCKVVLILMFNSNKKKTLEILAKIIRLAYNLHLIKDYEKVYNRLVDKLIIFVKDFRTNKALIFVDIFANVLRYFLKGCAIYFILVSLNFADGNAFGELLFKCVILQLILDFWPIQNGTFIFEFLFVILFKNIFFEGYIWWGIILYRLFDYFLYILAFGIYKLFDYIFDNKRRNIQKL